MRDPDSFPVCNLHGTRIVDAAPTGCPLIAPVSGAYRALYELQEYGYAKLGEQDFTGLDDLARYETCYLCVGRIASHPLVRRLRETPHASARVTSGTSGTYAGEAKAPESAALAIPRIQRLPRRRAR